MDILTLTESANLAAARTRTIAPAETGKAVDPQLRAVAQDFEAMMLEQVLKSMREANDALAEDGLLNTREQKFWREFQDTQLATELSRTQGLGLAEAIIAQVGHLQD